MNVLIEMFATFCSFSGDYCKICIVSLLKRIGDAYKADKKQHKFIEDLMALNIPDLLLAESADVEVAFVGMIHDFVQKYGLQQVIMEQVLMIVVGLFDSMCMSCRLIDACMLIM